MTGSGWERGVVRRLRRDRPLARATLITCLAVVVLAVLVAEFALEGAIDLAPRDGQTAAGGAPSAPLPGERSADAVPAPAERTAIGSLALEDPLDEAVEAFGPPARTEPDINSTRSHTWELEGGAVLVVTAGEGPSPRIAGLSASVPPQSPVELGLYGDLVVGRSTLCDVVAAWGDGYDAATHPLDDFALRYVVCVEAWPVVVKFDTASAGEREVGTFDAGATLTSAFIAFADADPGTAGCPATG